MSELVQPIAISKGRGSHEEVVHAVALASVLAWLNHPDRPSWEQWLSGRFTKSVRRGTPSQMAAVSPLNMSFVRIGEVEAMGFEPMAYEDFPHHLSKMQVANTERPRADLWPVYEEGPCIWVNEDLEMSTGKTAAQVAHGLFAWLLKRSEQERQDWLEGIPLLIEPKPEASLRKITPERGGIWIEDAGLTETEPGSLTVVVT